MRRSPRAIVATLAVRTWIKSELKWKGVCSDEAIVAHVEKAYPKFRPEEWEYVKTFAPEPERKLSP